jgi:hypothetical protein
VSEPLDLAHYLQHRQLGVYEQSMARLSYAYGVDIRRSRWLASSTLGNALVRAVDRGWPELATELLEQELDGPEGGRVPSGLLREIMGHMRLLRAPLPTLRRVRPRAASENPKWPLITPLGATHGGVHWLVLDVDAVQKLDDPVRAFVLGAGLGHLQCDHGVFYTAHVMASRREGGLPIRMIRRALTPWSRVMAFSADRAGMLATDSLEASIEGIGVLVARESEGITWLPHGPTFEQRRRALEEFARSAVYARVHALKQRQRDVASLVAREDEAPVGVPEDAWSLARVDRRLTQRLGIF